jgi:predicted nucleotide-binding protein (sugar kinase/HSP70/actin superfamily)
MVELIEHGYENIVCTQPFGCLPNHIVGKGMIRKLRGMYEQSNIVAIDYDPGATRVNQENRIKLMLAVAREAADTAAETGPSPADTEEFIPEALPIAN